jgi:hypothetical protein
LGPKEKGDLKLESEQSAWKVFSGSGELSEEALSGSRLFVNSSDLRNPAIPQGLAKFSTQTFNSPSGLFQVHFYANPQTMAPFYELDYKVLFNQPFP